MALMLLMRGGDINAVDAKGYTPLLVAIEFHHDDLAVVLLQRGANVTLCNHAKCSPLHVAALSGCKTVIVPLLQKGCNIDAVEAVRVLLRVGLVGRDVPSPLPLLCPLLA